MKKTRFISGIATMLAVSVILGLSMSSCSKSDDEPSQPEKRYTMEELVLPLTFDTFLSSSDVIIDSQDTTSLLVSKAYLDNIIKKEIVNELTYLAIWLAPNQLPFYKQVMDSEEVGNDRIRLTVAPADVSCCLPEGTYNLNTEVYVNKNESPRKNGDSGQINDMYYFDSEAGEYHPVAIIASEEGGANIDEGDEYDLSYDDLKSPMIEDWIAGNWTFDTALKLSFNTKEKYFGNDKDHVKLGLAYAKVTAEVGIKMTLDVSMDWKKKMLGFIPVWYPAPTLNEYAHSYHAAFNSEYESVFDAIATKSDTKDYTICECTPINTVFFIGPIPVLIDCTPEIVFSYKYNVTGKFGLAHYAKYAVSGETGSRYKGGKWEDFNNSKPSTKESHFGINVDGQFLGYVGVFFKVPMHIDKLAGPYLMVGPRLEANASGMAIFDLPSTNKDPYTDLKASVDIWVGAELGAELKLFNWKVTSPKIELQFFKTNLFKWPQ